MMDAVEVIASVLEREDEWDEVNKDGYERIARLVIAALEREGYKIEKMLSEEIIRRDRSEWPL